VTDAELAATLKQPGATLVKLGMSYQLLTGGDPILVPPIQAKRLALAGLLMSGQRHPGQPASYVVTAP